MAIRDLDAADVQTEKGSFFAPFAKHHTGDGLMMPLFVTATIRQKRMQ